MVQALWKLKYERQHYYLIDKFIFLVFAIFSFYSTYTVCFVNNEDCQDKIRKNIYYFG